MASHVVVVFVVVLACEQALRGALSSRPAVRAHRRACSRAIVV